MRIKKKHIKEDTNSKLNDLTADAESAITNIVNLGVDRDDAGAVVGSVMNTKDGVKEDSLSEVEEGLDYGEEPIEEVVESVKMTKNKLVESILGKKKTRKVLKTLKVKDLRNE